MKTKEQILAWLDRQSWKWEFYEAAVLSNRACKISYNTNLLILAFDWSITKQGSNVWKRRNEEYLKWYNAKDKPMSWEEYCRQNSIKEDDCYVSKLGEVRPVGCCGRRIAKIDITVMPKDHCEAFLAYMKLIQLRNAWVKNENLEELPTVYKILYQDGEFDIFRGHTSTGLSFVSEEDAKEFAETFRELLNIAKPLL